MNECQGCTFKVSTLRPRLYVRADHAQVGRGINLSVLKKRINDPAYSGWTLFSEEEVGEATSDVNGWNSQLATVAMRYLLRGNEEDALEVGKFMDEVPIPEEDLTASREAYGAMAFDWVRDALPEEKRRRIADKLARGAERLLRELRHPAVNHNYTYVTLYAFALASLAIYGEGEENTARAEQYLARVRELLESKGGLLDTFKEKSGVWAEGNHYSPFVVIFPFMMTLEALTTATNIDYFDKIRKEYNNFLEPLGKYLITNFRPDFTHERIGDMGVRWVNPNATQMRPTLELIAREQADQIFQAQMRSFCNEMSLYHGDTLVPDYYKWMMLTFYDNSLPTEPSYKTLPKVMRLGENAYELITFRNSWEEDGTMITYISGNHFTDHQHFDKGSFMIYHKGGLTADTGAYTSMYKDHWANYACRTLAHNCVLIYDPEEKPFEGVAGTLTYPDGGQRVIRGVQGNRSWDHYLEVLEEHRLDTAKVISFGYDPKNNEYAYVKSDLTNAYGEKAQWVDRQLVYLPKADYLVIKDRVFSKKPLEKNWLLHFVERPNVDGNVPDVGITEYPGAEVVRVRRTGELQLNGKTVKYDGGLWIRTLLPRERKTLVVGGKGYEFYNRFFQKNFGESPKDMWTPFAPLRESGSWRMEVIPEKCSTETVFLNALEITDAEKPQMVPTELLISEDGKMEGVQFLSDTEQYAVLFSKETQTGWSEEDLPITYSLNASAPTAHVVTELKPNRKVKVAVNGEDLDDFFVTEAGVLFFKDSGTGERSISIR